MSVRLQEAPFNPGAELNTFGQSVAGAGAIVSFTGLVRGDGGLQSMQIEHYPAMTEQAIRDMVGTASARWSLKDAMVIHRYGDLVPGETIMMVAVAAPHRADAFQAADYLMDYLKSRAPFWKKEVFASGRAEWVAAKDADEAALKRW